VELHEQLTSPELSNKLHQLGVTKPSVFWRDWTGSKSEELEWAENFEPFLCEDNVNCYSVAELGEILPQTLTIKKTKYQLFVSVALDKQWFVVYANVDDYHDNAPIKFMMCHNEADALAKMLIYLIENRLIPEKSY